MKQDSSLTNKWGMCRGWGDKEGLGAHLFTIGKVYREEEIEALGIRAWIQWHSQPLINLLFSLQGYCALFKFGSSFVFMIYDRAPLSPTSEVFYVEPRVWVPIISWLHEAPHEACLFIQPLIGRQGYKV